MASNDTDMVTARDTISGQVAKVPAIYLDIFKDHLERVDDDTKSRHPELHAEANTDGKDADGKQVRKPSDATTADPRTSAAG